MTGRILVLAGTTEARRLCAALAAENRDVTTSLAGVTRSPADYSCPVRTGGFGGVDGLTQWLRDHAISHLIDATHPHAARMPHHAHAAAIAAGIPCLHLKRLPWPVRKHYLRATSLEHAAHLLPAGARAFLATGAISSLTFHNRADVHFVLRSIEPPPSQFPAGNAIFLNACPPFTQAEEENTFREHAITHLVVKNSGGDAGRAKLDAADALGITTVMVDRPPLPPGAKTVTTVRAALDWLAKPDAC
ncbi:cobalt-precorrin-6A reductase [Amaricoccus tamworthensis]|uniref:cobalt-precorrin-6A reductase n=1 Tax=Amaricoccus tamworthensis TaxID=57002 RepID=UPI003C7DC179